MSNEFELNAKARADQGKGASRRLRRLAGEIPAIVYGGKKKPQAITVSHRELSKAIENEAFFSHIITLHIDGKKEQAVIKDLQRHPSRPFLMHADFQRVSAKQAIHVRVPLHFLNEETCKGVKLGGGSIIKNMTELEVECLPKDLPEYLEIDLAELDIGELIHISEIKLPAGVASVDLMHSEDADHAVVTVRPPRVVTEEDEEEAKAAEAESEEAEEAEKQDEKKDEDDKSDD
ncbi:MAG: 50S ribosomal protein L25/general stress protein Ctc [Pseudohongiellaceae bacterium]